MVLKDIGNFLVGKDAIFFATLNQHIQTNNLVYTFLACHLTHLSFKTSVVHRGVDIAQGLAPSSKCL